MFTCFSGHKLISSTFHIYPIDCLATAFSVKHLKPTGGDFDARLAEHVFLNKVLLILWSWFTKPQRWPCCRACSLNNDLATTLPSRHSSASFSQTWMDGELTQHAWRSTSPWHPPQPGNDILRCQRWIVAAKILKFALWYAYFVFPIVGPDRSLGSLESGNAGHPLLSHPTWCFDLALLSR